jgi:hypothetical protein
VLRTHPLVVLSRLGQLRLELGDVTLLGEDLRGKHLLRQVSVSLLQPSGLATIRARAAASSSSRV